MKWLLPAIAATSAATLVVVLSLALPGTSSPTRGDGTLEWRVSCLPQRPSWFIAIHKYDCNPRKGPDFNFASLYSPVLGRETTLRLPRSWIEATRDRSGVATVEPGRVASLLMPLR